MREPIWVPPQYFTGAGIKAANPADEKHADPAREKLRQYGLDPLRVPWCMIEMILHCDDPEKQYPLVRQSMQIELGLSQVFCPAPPDEDLKLRGQYTTHFRIGADVDHGIIIGVTTDAFRDAWAEQKKCFFECHLWVASWDDKVEFSDYLCTIIEPGDKSLMLVMNGDKPVIAPIDTARGFVCRYGLRNGWKA